MESNDQEKAVGDEIGNDKAKIRVCCVLVYLCFGLGFLWWYFDKSLSNNQLVKFHLKQMIVIVIAFLVIRFSMFPLLLFVPPVTLVASFISAILLFIPLLFGLVNAVQGVEKPVPVIGKFADLIKL